MTDNIIFNKAILIYFHVDIFEFSKALSTYIYVTRIYWEVSFSKAVFYSNMHFTNCLTTLMTFFNHALP